MVSSSSLLTLCLGVGLVQAGSTLLKGGTVIAFDATSQDLVVHRDSSVLITDDRIAAIFPVANPGGVKIPSQTTTVDVVGKIVSPGFVDTHRHGWQTGLKTVASNTSLAQYFGRYGEFVASAGYDAEDIYIGQLAGTLEALNAGVTSILDHSHCTWSDATSEAALNGSIDSGARVWHAFAVHELGTSYTVANQISKLKQLEQKGRYKGTPVTLGVAYDGFDGQPREVVEEVIATAKKINASVVTTHFLGGVWGADNSPEILHGYKFLNTSIPVVFSHASFITVAGSKLLISTNQHISITPESELHYGHDHPVSHLIQDQASIGVDTHFTFSTDIVTQARIWLQTVRRTIYRAVLEAWEISKNNPMSVNQAFLLSTRQGALALRRPDVGIIAVGAKADVVVFNGDTPGMLGWVDPVAAVILHSNVGDVEHVIVDGKFVKKDGKLTFKNYKQVQQRFLKSARKVQKFWKEFDYPVLEGGFNGNPVALLVDAKIVDAQRGPGNGYGQQFL